MAESLPYILNVGTLKKALEKVKDAATPERFTTDYLSETLGMKGGAARPVIPFLKKMGFLSENGVPTELYRQFRNPSASGGAIAEGLKKAYAPLFLKNENAHKLTDADLKGLVLETTGLDHDSRVVGAITGSIKLLKSLANFDAKPSSPRTSLTITEPPAPPPPPPPTPDRREVAGELPLGMNLSYTINLNLPATPDINVFNAIFRSLKESLLRR